MTTRYFLKIGDISNLTIPQRTVANIKCKKVYTGKIARWKEQ